MRATCVARDLSAPHAIATVFFGSDLPRGYGLIKARPAGSGIELCIRIEKFIPARNTFINAGCLCLVILAREGTFRSFIAADFVLIWRQFVFPLFFGFFDLVLHCIILRRREKKSRSSAEHSAWWTPGTTSTRWFNRGSVSNL